MQEKIFKEESWH